jgi:hypothetical protein
MAQICLVRNESKRGMSKTREATNRFWRWWGGLLPLGLAFGPLQSSRADDHFDYRYEEYKEDNHRMRIETHSADFEQQLLDSVTARGELVYDGISGATPTGTYRISPTSGLIRTVPLHDIRRAENVDLDWRLGNNTLTPGFAYSKESDYESYGVSLNDALDFNQKNTTLLLGGSHDFDAVQRNGNPFPRAQAKDASEFLIGVSQLLTPKTVFAANFTLGYESGYLSDPYRQTEFVYPLHFLGVVRYDNRPRVRDKEVFLTSITQYVEPLHASVEGSYRFYHDSYDVFAHAVMLGWHQWLGERVMLEPLARFYEQGSAFFYAPIFHADPASVEYYSADYRLSQFYSVDLGLQGTVLINRHARLTAGYHRYGMHGLDNTSPAMYPRADIITAGFSILW